MTCADFFMIFVLGIRLALIYSHRLKSHLQDILCAAKDSPSACRYNSVPQAEIESPLRGIYFETNIFKNFLTEYNNGFII
jgi:hypothetical protein